MHTYLDTHLMSICSRELSLIGYQTEKEHCYRIKNKNKLNYRKTIQLSVTSKWWGGSDCFPCLLQSQFKDPGQNI